MAETNNTKQAAWIAIGNFFSFLIGIVTPMILSRFFTKEDYGTYKQVMYVYDTLLVVFTLGLPRTYSYFLPKYPHEQSKAIISKITSVFFVLGSLFSLVLFTCATPIARWLNNEDLAFAIRLFSPTPFFLIPTLGLDGIYAAFRKTQFVALYTTVTRIFTIFCIILPVVIFDGNYLHAIVGFDIASCATFLLAMYMKNAPVKAFPKEETQVSYKDIFGFAFPLFYASIWGTIIHASNQFFISRYYGNAVFADYSNGFMQNPLVGMIVSSMAVVLLPVFSGMNKGDNKTDINQVFSVWRSSIIKSAKCVFPILIFSIFFANLLMICIYGDNYATSSIYFQIRNTSALLQIIPFAPIVLAIGKTKEYANAHLITAVLIVTLQFISVKTIDSPVAVAVISEFCRVFNIVLQMSIIARYFNVKISFMFPTKRLGRVLIVSILSAIIPLFFLYVIQLNKFVSITICFILYVICYYVLSWIFRVSYKEIVQSLIRSKKINWLISIIP